MKKLNGTRKYILQIKQKYGIDINEENYKKLLLDEMLRN